MEVTSLWSLSVDCADDAGIISCGQLQQPRSIHADCQCKDAVHVLATVPSSLRSSSEIYRSTSRLDITKLPHNRHGVPRQSLVNELYAMTHFSGAVSCGDQLLWLPVEWFAKETWLSRLDQQSYERLTIYKLYCYTEANRRGGFRWTFHGAYSPTIRTSHYGYTDERWQAYILQSSLNKLRNVVFLCQQCFCLEAIISYSLDGSEIALAVYGHKKTAEQRTIIQQYGGTLAVHGWQDLEYLPHSINPLKCRCNYITTSKCNSPPINTQCTNHYIAV